jgi:hypothetical protein
MGQLPLTAEPVTGGRADAPNLTAVRIGGPESDSFG